ncbi:MAG: YdiU family protein [Deltaproteobacteria bacterium]|jgi:uncharacterized protein YdiU (UPF0061 family)|nr:YdiU family protein [Deltaproteobacteria bacterium]
MSFKARLDYSLLPEGFSDPVSPAEFPLRELRFWNDVWAKRIGLGDLSIAEQEMYFAKFKALPGCQPKPLAMRYHGHQFRHYNPQLGDGRGFLYAQLEDPVDQRLLDFGTKGSGKTPYSRGGDGCLTLKGAVREALATEMLEALGVATSKTFCFFETGEALHRGDEPSPTRSAVLTRLSHGHIRYGTFQRFAAMGEVENLRRLLQYSTKVYFPAINAQEDHELVLRFFEEVTIKAAELAASWMMAGFVHGVLNTDNMNITGESFDYGPWRFLPFYDASFTAAYFDHEGLYCYGRQAEAVYWNLDQLARALFALAPESQESRWQSDLVRVLEIYPAVYRRNLNTKYFDRLGLNPSGSEFAQEELLTLGTECLKESKVPFESFFFDFYTGRLRNTEAAAKYSGPESLKFIRALKNGTWTANEAAKNRIAATGKGNEYFDRQVPEMMLIDEVETIWSAIDERDDWSLFIDKIARVRERGKIYGFGI